MSQVAKLFRIILGKENISCVNALAVKGLTGMFVVMCMNALYQSALVQKVLPWAQFHKAFRTSDTHKLCKL